MYFLDKIWSLLLEMSPFLLFGFIISGLLSILLTVEIVSKYLGGNKFKGIFLGSLFGVPLPLCSCGVIPVFSYLRKHGASKSATTSFLISTPQTGIDSILVTYGLLGPIFAIFRPIVAFLSGILGGLLVAIFDGDAELENSSIECDDDCCDENESKLYQIFNYGFVKLPQDIVNPLIIGIIFAAVIYNFIPQDYFSHIGAGFLGMFIMLLLGLPSYICATASVPIALALHMKGFSMGTLVVFLMTGPATNIATISVAIKQIGRKSTGIYLFSIIICSIIAGLSFDAIFPGLTVEMAMEGGMEMFSYQLQVASSIGLILILLNALRLNYFSKNRIHSESNNKNHILFVEGMTCNHCVSVIKKTLNGLSSIKVLNIDLKSGMVELDCLDEDLASIKKSIIDLGYKIKQEE